MRTWKIEDDELLDKQVVQEHGPDDAGSNEARSQAAKRLGAAGQNVPAPVGISRPC